MRLFSILLVGAFLVSDTCAVPAKVPPGFVPAIPGPPSDPKVQPGDGAGPYKSQKPGFREWVNRRTFRLAAQGTSKLLPHASRHLSHYLDNTGKDLIVDVNQLLEEYTAFQETVRQKAIGQYQYYFDQIEGKSGYKTFQIPWQGDEPPLKSEHDWNLALGKFYWSISGRVTKRSAKSGKVDYSVHIFDRYNWDGNLKVEFGPFELSDKQLGKQHLVGYAREYIARGSSILRQYSPDVIFV